MGGPSLADAYTDDRSDYVTNEVRLPLSCHSMPCSRVVLPAFRADWLASGGKSTWDDLWPFGKPLRAQ